MFWATHPFALQRRMSIATDDFWDDLLDLIEGGNVLPVVGQGITTMGPDDALLAPWLALRLAERLNIPATNLPAEPSLHDVICRHLMQGGERGAVYTRLFRILRDQPATPGPTLQKLASIGGLRLFVSATFDPLLATALNQTRHGGQPITRVCAYSPEAESKDLPSRKRDLPGSTVYHVLGKVSQVGDYVAWEEDMLEFICGLHQHMPVLPNLARDLADPNLRVLVLGLNFADWLVRFFLRVVRQSRLSTGMPRVDYMAEGPLTTLPESMVMFFGDVARTSGAVKNIQVIPCEPREFVNELARRWELRHPQESGGLLPTLPTSEPALEMPRGAVFISYAREDEAAIKRLKAGLEAHGCEVWYDRERLKSGMNFHHQLEDAVKRHCSLFVSVISRNTESQGEAYFHRERNWAAERAAGYPDVRRSEFYHPVVIDDIDLGNVKYEPRAFEGCQRTSLLNGAVTPEWGQRLVNLHRLHQSREKSY